MGWRRVALEQSELIERLSDVLGGTPVFRGTRVPVRTLMDYLESGQCVDDFVQDFPSVQPGQAVGVLELAAARVASFVTLTRQSAGLGQGHRPRTGQVKSAYSTLPFRSRRRMVMPRK